MRFKVVAQKTILKVVLHNQEVILPAHVSCNLLQQIE
jgi:hypothetical protein